MYLHVALRIFSISAGWGVGVFGERTTLERRHIRPYVEGKSWYNTRDRSTSGTFMWVVDGSRQLRSLMHGVHDTDRRGLDTRCHLLGLMHVNFFGI